MIFDIFPLPEQSNANFIISLDRLIAMDQASMRVVPQLMYCFWVQQLHSGNYDLNSNNNDYITFMIMLRAQILEIVLTNKSQAKLF